MEEGIDLPKDSLDAERALHLQGVLLVHQDRRDHLVLLVLRDHLQDHRVLLVLRDLQVHLDHLLD